MLLDKETVLRVWTLVMNLDLFKVFFFKKSFSLSQAVGAAGKVQEHRQQPDLGEMWVNVPRSSKVNDF